MLNLVGAWLCVFSFCIFHRKTFMLYKLGQIFTSLQMFFWLLQMAPNLQCAWILYRNSIKRKTHKSLEHAYSWRQTLGWHRISAQHWYVGLSFKILNTLTSIYTLSLHIGDCFWINKLKKLVRYYFKLWAAWRWYRSQK